MVGKKSLKEQCVRKYMKVWEKGSEEKRWCLEFFQRGQCVRGPGEGKYGPIKPRLISLDLAKVLLRWGKRSRGHRTQGFILFQDGHYHDTTEVEKTKQQQPKAPTTMWRID